MVSAGLPMRFITRHIIRVSVNILFVALIAVFVFSSAFAQTPKEQMQSGVTANEISCKTGHVLFLKASDGSPVCIRQESADTLAGRGWGKVVERTTEHKTVAAKCDGISSSNIDIQVSTIESDLECIPAFFDLLEAEPERHLPAFYTLVASPVATDLLFTHMYGQLYNKTFVVDKKIAEQMAEDLPLAAEKCTGSFRCPDWQKFIIPALVHSDAYSGQTIHDCDAMAGYDQDQLIEALRNTDYYCTEQIATLLQKGANSTTITKILNMLQTDDSDNARRNAWRVIIRFAELDNDAPPHVLVTDTMSQQVKDAVLETLKNERSSFVIPELTVLIDAHFRPYYETLQYLEKVSGDSGFDSVARWRATNAARNIMYEKQSLTEGDIKFIVGSLESDELWVRAEAAFAAQMVKDDQASQEQKNRIVSSLQRAYDLEEEIIPKSFMAKALDRYQGTAQYDTLKERYEQMHLRNTITKNHMTVRSDASQKTMDAYIQLMNGQRQEFFDVMGPKFQTPVAGDPNESMTLMLFATPDDYSDYMNAFVGYAANAGGLYLEDRGILYTFERNETQNTYSTADLIRHEFTHYLEGRYVYSGMWNDSTYHAEPKGWADEGTAEFFAQNATAGPPQKYVDQICNTKFKDLHSLLSQRIGYDDPGQWDYANGWSFVYYMMTEKRDAAEKIYSSFRDGSYRLDDFERIAGVSLESLESGWHDTERSWCAQ